MRDLEIAHVRQQVSFPVSTDCEDFVARLGVSGQNDERLDDLSPGGAVGSASEWDKG